MNNIRFIEIWDVSFFRFSKRISEKINDRNSSVPLLMENVNMRSILREIVKQAKYLQDFFLSRHSMLSHCQILPCHKQKELKNLSTTKRLWIGIYVISDLKYVPKIIQPNRLLNYQRSLHYLEKQSFLSPPGINFLLIPLLDKLPRKLWLFGGQSCLLQLSPMTLLLHRHCPSLCMKALQVVQKKISFFLCDSFTDLINFCNLNFSSHVMVFKWPPSCSLIFLCTPICKCPSPSLSPRKSFIPIAVSGGDVTVF